MTARLIDSFVAIHAPPEEVWRALTEPSLMTEWMAEPAMRVEIATDWTVGAPIVVKGSLHGRFESKGTVLRFEPYLVLEYTHLSSISRLRDAPANYTKIEFHLAPLESQSTQLRLRVSNFPTEAIFRHFDFYWRMTLPILKRLVEALRSPAGSDYS